jgi:hypothetical protein
VPVDERSTRSAERCDQHPTRSAVATCAGCGRPLCLTCAVPVRGAVLGVECLPEPLGDDPAPAPRAARSSPLQLVTAGAFVLALVATVVPWSRFGVGAGAFGAWDQAPRWSSLAAAAAVLGCLAWGARRLLLPSRRWLDVAIAVLGGLVGVGAALSIWHPPAFTRTWIGPWLALAAGAIACASSVAAERTPRGPVAAPI